MWQLGLFFSSKSSSIYRREGGEEAASNPQGLAEIGGGGGGLLHFNPSPNRTPSIFGLPSLFFGVFPFPLIPSRMGLVGLVCPAY